MIYIVDMPMRYKETVVDIWESILSDFGVCNLPRSLRPSILKCFITFIDILTYNIFINSEVMSKKDLAKLNDEFIQIFSHIFEVDDPIELSLDLYDDLIDSIRDSSVFASDTVDYMLDLPNDPDDMPDCLIIGLANTMNRCVSRLSIAYSNDIREDISDSVFCISRAARNQSVKYVQSDRRSHVFKIGVY